MPDGTTTKDAHIVMATATIGRELYPTRVDLPGGHSIQADEPKDLNGQDTGSTPMNLLMGALASCKAITMRMYADRKGWPLERATVEARHQRISGKQLDGDHGAAGLVDVIDCTIQVEGPELTDDQRTKIYEIAERCPVHRMLAGETRVRSTLTT